MALKHGYARLSARGLSEAAQRAALEAAGVKPGRIHLDDHRKPRRDRALATPGRDEAVNCVRPGDTLIVASPGRLGVSRDDVRAVVRLVAERGGQVQVAGGEPFGGPAVAALVAFEDAAHTEVERERTAPMRKARGDTLRKELRGKLREEVLAMWRDPGRHTAQECEMRGKVSRRWMYQHFGPRMDKP